MPAGSIAVRCKFWNRIPNQAGILDGDWFERPEQNIRQGIKPTVHKVWLRNVLLGTVGTVHPEEDLSAAEDIFLQSYNRRKKNHAAVIDGDLKDRIVFERHLRDKLDLIGMLSDLPLEALKRKEPPVTRNQNGDETESKRRRLNALLNRSNKQ